MTRVAVTGMGAVTPLGATALSSFEALVAGRTGVDRTSFPLDEQQYESRIAAEVRDVDIAGVLGAREARRHGRYTQLALVALKEALADAGWDAMRYERHRLASILGVGFGGLEALEEAAETAIRRGARRVSPFGITMLVPNMAAGQIATVAAAHGPCWATATACASGAHAIGQAVRLLRDGTVDAVITGGAEACVTPLALAGFARMGALSTRNDDPLRAARPFDRDRDGFVIGEGAAQSLKDSSAFVA